MRCICYNPKDVKEETKEEIKKEKNEPKKPSKEEKEETENECSICMENKIDTALVPCGQ